MLALKIKCAVPLQQCPCSWQLLQVATAPQWGARPRCACSTLPGLPAPLPPVHVLRSADSSAMLRCAFLGPMCVWRALAACSWPQRSPVQATWRTGVRGGGLLPPPAHSTMYVYLVVGANARVPQARGAQAGPCQRVSHSTGANSTAPVVQVGFDSYVRAQPGTYTISSLSPPGRR